MANQGPTLSTITMVEDVLREIDDEINIAELKRRLPKQVNHNTLKMILEYLQESGKIVFSIKGVSWTGTVFAKRRVEGGYI